MSVGSFSVLALAAGLSLAAAPAQAATRSKPCRPKGSVTVAKSDGVRVYLLPALNDAGKEVAGKYFACRYSTNKAYVLAEYSRGSHGGAPGGPNGDLVNIVRISGTWVAAGLRHVQEDLCCSGALIRRIDLATGATQDVCVRVTECSRTKRDNEVTDLDLMPGGQLAWIDRYIDIDTNGKPLTYIVGRFDSRGATLLDSGADVDPRSVATSGSIVYWTRSGTPYSSDII